MTALPPLEEQRRPRVPYSRLFPHMARKRGKKKEERPRFLLIITYSLRWCGSIKKDLFLANCSSFPGSSEGAGKKGRGKTDGTQISKPCCAMTFSF